MEITREAVWAITYSDADSPFARLLEANPRSGDLVGSVPVGVAPYEIEAAGDRLWVSNGWFCDVVDTCSRGPEADSPPPWFARFPWEGSLMEVDPATMSTRAIHRSPLGPFEASRRTMWYPMDSSYPVHGSVKLVDQSTLEVDRRIKLPGLPIEIAVGYGSLWALVEREGSAPALVRMDEESGRVTGVLTMWGGDRLALGGGEVWVANNHVPDGRIVRIDPDRMRVTGRTRPLPGLGWRGSLEYGAGAVWTVSQMQIVRVDPVSLEAVSIRTHPPVHEVWAGPGSVWVSTPRGFARVPAKVTNARW